MQSKKTHKIKVNALFHRLQINKNIRFQTRIVWKRRSPRPTQTPTRPKPDSSVTTTASLSSRRTLPSSSTWSTTRARESTRTRMYVWVDADRDSCGHFLRRQGQERRVRQVQHRPGHQPATPGYAPSNVDTVVTIPLSQCPDPSANVQVTFNYSL